MSTKKEPAKRAADPSLFSKPQIAKERIEMLLAQAQKYAKQKPAFAKRCISLARKISRRYRVRFTKMQKLSFCKECETPLLPGYNVSIHLLSKKRLLVHECKNCQSVHHYCY